MTAEENRQLLAVMDAHRHFLVMACRDTPTLLQASDERLRQLVEWLALATNKPAQAIHSSGE